MSELTIKEQETAKDIANTVIYFHQHKGCFKTKDEMRSAVWDDVLSRYNGKKATEIAVITEQMIIDSGKWRMEE